jgi:hypothetical protein
MYTNKRIRLDIDIKSIDQAHSSNATSAATIPTASSMDSDDKYLANLLHMSHRTYDINDIPDDLIHETPSNYMDVMYLQEYIKNLDEQLDATWEDDQDEILLDPNRVKRPPPSREPIPDKELVLRNSDSVISWLRRNHPETFIQDKDNDKDKTEPKKRGGGKRASVAAPKKEPEEVEEEMEALPELPVAEKSIKGKKHKEDEPYRPKGGSSKSAKRKRADDAGETPSKPAGRGKRAKA